MRDVPFDPQLRLRREAVRHRRRHVVDAHHLQPRIGLEHRRDERQAGDPAQHRGAAIDRRRQHQSGPQDHPVERWPPRKIVLRLGLAARERGRRRARRADRRDVHHALDAGALAGREQRAGRRDMNALHVVAHAVLQHADAIHHRVEAFEQRQPVAGQRQLAVIGRDPLRIGRAALGLPDGAACAGDLVAVAMQPRKARRPDQPIGSGHQHAHRIALFRIDPGSPSGSSSYSSKSCGLRIRS